MAKSVYEKFGQSALTGTSQSARRYIMTGSDTIPFVAAAVYPDDGYSAENWRQIAEYNNVDDLDDLGAGDILTIPTLQPPST